MENYKGITIKSLARAIKKFDTYLEIIITKWYWYYFFVFFRFFANISIRKTTDLINKIDFEGLENHEQIIDHTHSAWRAVDRRNWHWKRSRNNRRYRWRAGRPGRSARSLRRPSNWDNWRSFSGSGTGPSDPDSPVEVSAAVISVVAAARWDSATRLCRPDCSEVPDIVCRDCLRHGSP